ncbi:MAG: hypothetical protein UH239_00805 [Acutalibacteraceae bacterium]|nr:hypothetical protein [Acutalibacteraceae bacterium]
MKKITSVLLTGCMAASMCAVGAFSASAEVTELPADWDPTAYNYTVVGDANLFGDADQWNPENDAYNMEYDEAAGIWYFNFTGVGNDGATDINYGAQYKVVVRDYLEGSPWEFSFNESGVAYGYDSNSLVSFPDDIDAASTVTIMFDGQVTSSRVNDPYTPATTEHTYFAVGDANLFTDDPWNPSASQYQMTKGEDGIYSVSIPVTEAQWEAAFEYKVAEDGTWDVSYNDQGPALGDGTNAIGFIDVDSTAVVITFDPTTQKTDAYCVVATEDETKATEATEATEATDATEATEATDATDATEVATTDATSATSATTATSAATTTATSATSATSAKSSSSSTTSSSTTSSTATGKVATGDSTSVAILLSILMMAGAAVVVAKKRIAD